MADSDQQSEADRPVTIVAVPSEAATPAPAPSATPVPEPPTPAPAPAPTPATPAPAPTTAPPPVMSPAPPPSSRPSSRMSEQPRQRLRRPDSVMSVTGHWPVPQVIVYYRELKLAWGREAIAALGKMEFMKWLYITFVWQPPEPGQPFVQAHYDASPFVHNAAIYGTFYHTFGRDDSGPVLLGSLGWEELIRNVLRIELIYSES